MRDIEGQNLRPYSEERTPISFFFTISVSFPLQFWRQNFAGFLHQFSRVFACSVNRVLAAAMPVESQVIKPIAKGIVHRICAGQVILDLSSAIKELVENSLDAGATSIEIALKDFGEEWFQVIDNGSGISPNSFKVL